MTPTLFGRIQTRIFNVLIIGGLWTLVVTPFVGIFSGTFFGLSGYFTSYWVLFRVLLWVTGLGVLWELGYHGLQQFRWEKDWPILYILLVGIPEGILVFFVIKAVGWPAGVTFGPFFVHFATTWVVSWMWINGPHRILFLRWRFEGGRFL